MAKYHPDRETLERYSLGALLQEESAWIESHLRSGCAVCQQTVDGILATFAPRSGETAGNAAWDEAWDEEDCWRRVFTRLEQRVTLISLERDAAPGLVAELLGLPRAQREAIGQEARRYQTLAVCELLIERSFEEGFEDPPRSIEIAELAILLSDRLDAEHYGHAVVQDLRARAWAYLGNARRISSDLLGAEKALAHAEALAEEGSADPLEEARLLDLKASLLSDQGRFEKAAEVLDVVIDIYDEVRDPHRKGRALISQGLFLSYAGRPEKTVERIRQGLSLIDAATEARLVLMARHNLAWALSDCGQPEEALRYLESFRSGYAEFPNAWTGLRLQWLEGRIAAGLGRLDEAGSRLREVRQGFVEQGLGYDASMVTLDLAALYLQEDGRGAEIRRLAAEMLPIFLSQDVHRQALAALAAFQHAAEMDRATPRLVQEITAYLMRARRNPLLRFEGPRFEGSER